MSSLDSLPQILSSVSQLVPSLLRTFPSSTTTPTNLQTLATLSQASALAFDEHRELIERARLVATHASPETKRRIFGEDADEPKPGEGDRQGWGTRIKVFDVGRSGMTAQQLEHRWGYAPPEQDEQDEPMALDGGGTQNQVKDLAGAEDVRRTVQEWIDTLSPLGKSRKAEVKELSIAPSTEGDSPAVEGLAFDLYFRPRYTIRLLFVATGNGLEDEKKVFRFHDVLFLSLLEASAKLVTSDLLLSQDQSPEGSEQGRSDHGVFQRLTWDVRPKVAALDAAAQGEAAKVKKVLDLAEKAASGKGMPF